MPDTRAKVPTRSRSAKRNLRGVGIIGTGMIKVANVVAVLRARVVMV